MTIRDDCIKKIRALSDGMRFSIIDLLMRGPSPVNSISKKLGIKQYNVSKHLHILENAGLVSQRKNGQKRIYSLRKNFLGTLRKDKSKLVLGCCTFDFNKLRG